MAINDERTALLTMSPAQFRSEWRRVLRAPPPDLTPDLLRRGIAYLACGSAATAD